MTASPDKQTLVAHALRSLCHDLRSPLTAVLTNLEFARRQISATSRDAELVESLEDSILSCEMIRRMVANLDILSWETSTSDTLEYHTVGDIVLPLIKTYSDHAALGDIRISPLRMDESARVFVDRRLLAIALENVFANAIHHAPRRSTVVISMTQDEEHIELHIDDDGPLLTAEHQKLATSLLGQTQDGRVAASRYSSGLALFAAKTAADVAGAHLRFDQVEQSNRTTIRVPKRPTQDVTAE